MDTVHGPDRIPGFHQGQLSVPATAAVGNAAAATYTRGGSTVLETALGSRSGEKG